MPGPLDALLGLVSGRKVNEGLAAWLGDNVPPDPQGPAPQAQFPKAQPVQPYPADVAATQMDAEDRASGYPSAYDPSKTVRGTMSYGGPRLNTASALAGLQAASAASMPEVGRIANAFDIRSTGRPQDLTYGNAILNDVGQSMAPQNAMVQKIMGAQSELNPSVQAASEADARRKAYPAEAQGEAVLGAADAKAQGDMMQAALDAQQKQHAANMIPLDSLFKALSDYDSLKNLTPDAAAQRQNLIKTLMLGLQQRGITIAPPPQQGQ